jgi:hypothetical protein
MTAPQEPFCAGRGPMGFELDQRAGTSIPFTLIVFGCVAMTVETTPQTVIWPTPASSANNCDMTAAAKEQQRRARKRRMVGFAEACDEYLNISHSKGYELIRLGQFPVPVHRVGGVWRISVADLERLTGVEDEEPA